MFHIAIQIRELISSNVTAALDGASDPAKMLVRLQREIEEALIALTGERTKARRQAERLAEDCARTERQEADWGDKARIAMDAGREDLARGALLARTDCRTALDRLRQDSDRLKAEIAEMDSAMDQLESKRADVRQRVVDQLATEGNSSGTATRRGFAERTERRMDHIANLEKRTAFATDSSTTARDNAAVDREIDEMRREHAVDAELAALREASARDAAKGAAKKGGKRVRAG